MTKGKKGILGAIVAGGAALAGYGIFQLLKKPNYVEVEVGEDDVFEEFETDENEDESEE